MSTPSGPEREPRRAPSPDRRRFLLGGAVALVAVACGRAATDAGGTDATKLADALKSVQAWVAERA
jgi:hypothetical protein